MSGPRSLRAAFQACQPLRVWHHYFLERALIDISQKSFPPCRNQPCHRNFHASPNSLLAESHLNSSNMPRDPSQSNSPIESPKHTKTTTTAAGEPTSSTSSSSPTPSPPEPPRRLRAPRAVQASYLQPLRRPPPIHGHPVCTLQLRSFSVRNVEFMTDFAMRAAFYLHLRAKGPVPLPKIVQRWTVLKSNFVNKEAQENFERITLRRLIQIQDGHPHVVQIWLAYLRKYAYWGVGMKANIWEFEGLGKSFTNLFTYSLVRSVWVVLRMLTMGICLAI
jgi:ribosomal protein S10